MSREFGSYCDGYFHQQIDYAADDCLKGSAQITKLWGEFLRVFQPVAEAISSCEASDSGEYSPIIASIEKMTELNSKLENIENYLRPYKDVMETAVYDAIKVKEKLNK